MKKKIILLASIALIFTFVGITNASLFDVFVPESAILLLLGFGLVIVSGIVRWKIFKKKE